MRKFTIALLAIFSSIAAFAQSAPGNDIQTITGRMSHFGFYGALGVRGTSFHGKSMATANARLGLIANRFLGVGIEGHGLLPVASYGDIIPGINVVPVGGYGGLTLEPILFSNKAIHFTFPVHGGAGWMGYVHDWSRNDFYDDDYALIEEDLFWYVEPGANVEINISKIMRLNVGVSKRFVQDLTLTNTNNQSFSGLSYGFSLKIGRF